MTRGVRKIDGRYFLLSGRGTREHMEHEAASVRKRYRYVRIVPAHPYLPKDIRGLVDDWMLYVFEAR